MCGRCAAFSSVDEVTFTMMRAVQIKTFGEPELLELVEVPDPPVGPGTALVRMEAASINPSDVKNVAGAMHQTTLPRIPGRDYAGVVEQGPPEWIGAAVWGTGGDVGFTRDGTHAERIAVPLESLRRKPERLNFAEAASVGVNYMAAWCGLVEAVALAAGETLAIIGAGGGVGGAAAQIAHRIGAHVIGVDTLKRDLTASANVLDALTPGFEAGDYRPPPIAQTVKLSEARDGYRRVAAGTSGRIVLTPQL